MVGQSHARGPDRSRCQKRDDRASNRSSPKLLLARLDGLWYLPRGRAHSTHILKPRLAGRPDGLAREHYGHALAVELGLAHYRTELVGNGARQHLLIESYDRAVNARRSR